MTRWRGFWLVLGVAFMARAIFLLGVGSDSRSALAPDSIGYIRACQNIRFYKTFSQSQVPPLIPDTVRTPGYPLFLSAFCDQDCPKVRSVLWAQAVLGALAAGLVYLGSLLLWKNSLGAVLAGLGEALDAVTVLHTGLLYTEILFLASFALAYFLLLKAFDSGFRRRAWPWWLAAGFGFGVTALVRPIGLYFFIFAAALVLILQGWKAALSLFVISAVLAPAGWMARNRAVAGTWTFSSIQGLNLAQMRAAAVEMELSGISYGQAMDAVEKKIDETHPGGFNSPAEKAAYSGRWAAHFLLRHPFAYLKVMLKDTVKMLGGHGMEMAAWMLLKDGAYDPMHPEPYQGHFSGTRGLVRRHPALGVAIIGYVLWLAFAYLLACAGFLAAWRSGQAGAAMVSASPILYFIAVSAGALAYYRFRIPLMPAVFILAGRGAGAILERRAAYRS